MHIAKRTLRAVGSILEIYPSTHYRPLSSQTRDARKLKGYWAAVGNDLERTIRKSATHERQGRTVKDRE